MQSLRIQISIRARMFLSQFLCSPEISCLGSIPRPNNLTAYLKLFIIPELIRTLETARGLSPLNSPVSCRTNMDHKKSTETMGKALAEFEFRFSGKHFYGTKRL
jgi:hypothetical protein